MRALGRFSEALPIDTFGRARILRVVPCKSAEKLLGRGVNYRWKFVTLNPKTKSLTDLWLKLFEVQRELSSHVGGARRLEGALQQPETVSVSRSHVMIGVTNIG